MLGQRLHALTDEGERRAELMGRVGREARLRLVGALHGPQSAAGQPPAGPQAPHDTAIAAPPVQPPNALEQLVLAASSGPPRPAATVWAPTTAGSTTTRTRSLVTSRSVTRSG